MAGLTSLKKELLVPSALEIDAVIECYIKSPDNEPFWSCYEQYLSLHLIENKNTKKIEN